MVSTIITFHPYSNVRSDMSIRMSVARLFAEIQRRRKINATIRQLSELSDHQLRDIGIERFEIKESVHRLQKSFPNGHRAPRGNIGSVKFA